MFVTRLELIGFRSYDRWTLEPGPEVTVLVGPNAAGKTNVIEALELVTTTESFRHPRWDELVRWESAEARVTVHADGETGPVSIAMAVSEEGRRAFRVDGQARRRSSDVEGIVPAVTFTPDDLDFVKGPAEVRRTSIDTVGDQLSQVYRATRRDYLRVVRQRNALLREGGGAADLEPWDEQLLTLGTKVTLLRARLFRRLAAAAAEAYTGLAGGEDLAATYEDSAKLGPRLLEAETDADAVREAIARRLGERAAEERARQATLVGPHRDDIAFLLGGRMARSYASQGQQRTIALAWKLAELVLLEDALHRRPILLLDDVMSELDESRRRALTDIVSGRIQTFITTTNVGYFDPSFLARAAVVDLGERHGEAGDRHG